MLKKTLTFLLLPLASLAISSTLVNAMEDQREVTKIILPLHFVKAEHVAKLFNSRRFNNPSVLHITVDKFTEDSLIITGLSEEVEKTRKFIVSYVDTDPIQLSPINVKHTSTDDPAGLAEKMKQDFINGLPPIRMKPLLEKDGPRNQFVPELIQTYSNDKWFSEKDLSKIMSDNPYGHFNYEPIYIDDFNYDIGKIATANDKPIDLTAPITSAFLKASKKILF